MNKKNRIIMIIYVIAIIAIGIYLTYKNGTHPGMFICGSIFFFPALNMGMNLKEYGIIAFLTMGAVGFYIMMQALLGDLFSNPMLTDVNATKFYLYLYLINGLTIIGIIYVVIYNLSNILKKMKYAMFIPITIVAIILILTGILPNILDKFI